MADLPDIASAIGTVGAAIIAFLAAWDARRSAARQIRESARQHEETQHQASIALEALLAEQDRALQTWAEEVIARMSEAHTLCLFDPQRMPDGAFFHKRAELAWQLSALADRGRLFLPNIPTEKLGANNPVAFRGLRSPVLDHVVNACRLLGKLRARSETALPSEIAGAMISAKREFVSEIQKVVDPRTRQERLRKLAGRNSEAST